MRFPIIAACLAFASLACAELYVFSPDGKTPAGAPRELPSLAVRLDDGKAVLGLHAAPPEVKAACGWHRVVPSAVKAATNQYVAARAYAIEGAEAREILTLADRPARPAPTARQRIDAIFAALGPAMAEEDKICAVLAETAAAITNRLAAAEAAAKTDIRTAVK